jgi:hypothetical protein
MSTDETIPEHDVTPNRCPNCEHILEEATGITTQDAPKPNDVTLCIYCAAVLVFTEDMRVRLPTEEESNELASNSELMRMQKIVKMQVRRRNVEGSPR